LYKGDNQSGDKDILSSSPTIAPVKQRTKRKVEGSMNAPLKRWWIPDGFFWGLYEKIMREGPDFLHYPDKALLPDPLFARFLQVPASGVVCRPGSVFFCFPGTEDRGT